MRTDRSIPQFRRGPGSKSLNNPGNAYDNNTNTSMTLSVSHQWTQGYGTTYATATYSGFTSGSTPVSIKMNYYAYADGNTANCPAKFKAEFYNGSWHTWFTVEDIITGGVTNSVASTWTAPQSLTGTPGSGLVQVRITVEASRLNTGCGFSGATANGGVTEIEMLVNDCAHPVNFLQNGSGWTDSGGGIHFNYALQSSTGVTSDLSACDIYDRLTANPDPFASPPFPSGFPSGSNPQDVLLDSTPEDGGASDGQYPPPSWVTPYAAATGTREQHYLFTCPCYSGGSLIVIDGPYTITRSVSQNGDGSWKYTVSKSGVSNEINPLP